MSSDTTIHSKPSQRALFATYAAFTAAQYPSDSEGKVNVAALERILSPSVEVEYFGYGSHEWKKLEGSEATIKCLVEEATKEFTVLKREQKLLDSGLEVNSETRFYDGRTLYTQETYTMSLENEQCVIKHVRAFQRMQ